MNIMDRFPADSQLQTAEKLSHEFLKKTEDGGCKKKANLIFGQVNLMVPKVWSFPLNDIGEQKHPD